MAVSLQFFTHSIQRRTTLSLEQVTDIVNGKRVVGPRKDILEVKNAITAYDELLECNPYSERDLLKQHSILMKGLVKDAGKYRSGGIAVFSGKSPVHIAPQHHRVYILMGQLLDWAKQAPLPQVVKSCIFHYEFEFIHPFSDGNGRMGRMWQTLLLYQENPVFAWLPVETIVAQRQSEYYRAIRRSTQKNDSGIFARFMLTAIRDTITDYKDKQNSAGINAGINAGIKLSETQKKIIQMIAENNCISQSDLAGKLSLSVSTVYRNMEKLKDLKIIERMGAKKDGQWILLRRGV